MANVHYTHCPVCGSDHLTAVFSAKDYTVSGRHFEIMECGYCRVRFTQDAPPLEEIGAFYKSEDYISHTNSSKGLINHLYKKVRSYTITQKAGIVRKYTGLEKGSLLDVGCGVGTFLHYMKTEGWLTTGLEPDADARQLAASLYGLNTEPSHALFSLPPGHFDAITLWHVLEHVHDLHGYLNQLKNLLKPAGKLFLAVPNYTSRDAMVYGKYWAAYDVPRHLYHFSPLSMDILLQQHGFQLEKQLPMWFDSFYVSLLSSKYKTGSTRLVSGALHGLASNLRALGNTGACSSVIYVAGQK